MNYKKWLPTALTVVLGVIATLTPQIQGALSAHPGAAAGIAAAYAIIKGLMPSPLQ